MTMEDAETGGLEQDEEQVMEQAISSTKDEETPAATGWSKRRKRVIIAICALVVVVVAITLSLGYTLSRDDDDERSPYQDIVDELGLDRNSSDTALEQAMVALADRYLTKCPAGVSIAVTRNDTRVIVPRGVLKINDDEAAEIDQDTLFEVGSVSKPFTGLVLAEQVVAGVVTLDTPLNERLPDSVPDLVVNGELVTFRQLVTHTAGFPRLSKNIRDKPIDDDLKGPNPYAGYSEADLLREIGIASSELSQTGEVEYSNFGFSTLAYLLGRNKNTTFPALQKDLTDRLGLNNTWIETLPEYARQNLSTGYRGRDVVPFWFDGGVFINGGGSTVSSTRDLLEHVELLMAPEEKLLQDEDLVETLQLSLTSLKETGDHDGVAFAWFYDGVFRFWIHTGATAGFLAFVAFQPETRTGVVVLTNCGDTHEMYDIGNALASNLFLFESQ